MIKSCKIDRVGEKRAVQMVSDERRKRPKKLCKGWFRGRFDLTLSFSRKWKPPKRTEKKHCAARFESAPNEDQHGERWTCMASRRGVENETPRKETREKKKKDELRLAPQARSSPSRTTARAYTARSRIIYNKHQKGNAEISRKGDREHKAKGKENDRPTGGFWVLPVQHQIRSKDNKLGIFGVQGRITTWPKNPPWPWCFSFLSSLNSRNAHDWFVL